MDKWMDEYGNLKQIIDTYSQTILHLLFLLGINCLRLSALFPFRDKKKKNKAKLTLREKEEVILNNDDLPTLATLWWEDSIIDP